MLYPTINRPNTHKATTETFAGLNFCDEISANQFSEEMNLSCEHYPVLTMRQKRLKKTYHGVFSNSKLVFGYAGGKMVESIGAYLYYDGHEISEYREHGYSASQMVVMGVYVILFPCGFYFNTLDTSDCGIIDKEATFSDVVANPSTLEGEKTSYKYRQASAPKNPTNGDRWIDTTDGNYVMKIWSESTGMWVEQVTSYCKLEATGIGTGYKVYDTVNISGFSVSSQGDPMVIAAVEDMNNDQIVYGCGDDFLIISCPLFSKATSQTTVTISQTMPQMDYVIECNNRLWGCKYGTDDDGNMLNEIYACKLGDFHNWHNFMGISTDSYTMSIGSDGAFTGAINYNGYPYFFKEDRILKIYGSYPSAYQLIDTPCKGVQNGSWKSLTIVNRILYYKGIDGVYAYDGSSPTLISDAFCNRKYSEAIGGSIGFLYYLDVTGEDTFISNGITFNKRHLFVYDSAKGIWHEESTYQEGYRHGSLNQFYTDGNNLYAIIQTSQYVSEIVTMNGSDGDSFDESYSWTWTTGRIDGHYITTYNIDYNLWRIKLRSYIPKGEKVVVELQYNDSGKWEQKQTFRGRGIDRYDMDILTRRCDSVRLRVSGTDESVKFYGLYSIYEEGCEH